MSGPDLSTLNAPELKQLLRLARGWHDGPLIDRIQWEIAERAALSSRLGFQVDRSPDDEAGEALVDVVRAFRPPAAETGSPPRRVGLVPAMIGGLAVGSLLTVGAVAGARGLGDWRMPARIELPVVVAVAERPAPPKPRRAPRPPSPPSSTSDAVASALAPEPFPPVLVEVAEAEPAPPAVPAAPLETTAAAPVEVAQAVPEPPPVLEPDVEVVKEKVSPKKEVARTEATRETKLAGKKDPVRKAAAAAPDAKKDRAAKKKDAKAKTEVAGKKKDAKARTELAAKTEPPKTKSPVRPVPQAEPDDPIAAILAKVDQPAPTAKKGALR